MADDVNSAIAGMKDFVQQQKMDNGMSQEMADALNSELDKSARGYKDNTKSAEAVTVAMKKVESALSYLMIGVEQNSTAMAMLKKAQHELGEKTSEVKMAMSTSKGKIDSFKNAIISASSALESISSIASSTTGESLGKAMGASTKQMFMSLAEGLSVVQPELAPFALAIGVAALVVNKFVEAADASTVAQRGAAEGLLQMGASTDKIGLGAGSLTDKILAAGTAFNYQQPQVAALSKAFADAGIAVKATSTGMDRAAMSADAMQNAVHFSSLMARSNGIELEKSAAIFTRFGTQFQVSGADMEGAFVSFSKGIDRSGVGATVFAKEFTSVSEALKPFGETISTAVDITSTWAKEIQHGTMTAQSAASAYETERGTLTEMVQGARLILSTNTDVAKKMGLREGMTPDQMVKVMMSEQARSAFRDAGGAVGTTQGYAESHGAGGTSLFMAEQLTKLLGTTFSPEGLMAQLSRGGKLDKGGPETTAQVVAAQEAKAKDALDKLSTSGEKLADAARRMSDMALLADKAAGIRSGVVAVFDGAVGKFASAVDLIGSPKREKPGFSEAGDYKGDDHSRIPSGASWAFPGRKSGGLIGETGLYKMHAGEMVNRPGEGSGININAGGINVSVGSHGDVGAGLDAAFSKLKAEVMTEIADQWSRAQPN